MDAPAVEEPNGKGGVRMKRLLLVVGALVAAAVGAAIAFAAVPDTNGVIHGCYGQSNGAVRVIDPGVAACKQGEVSLDWSSGPRAYAEVRSDGGIEFGSRNVTSATVFSTGVYCVFLDSSLDAGNVDRRDRHTRRLQRRRRRPRYPGEPV